MSSTIDGSDCAVAGDGGVLEVAATVSGWGKYGRTWRQWGRLQVTEALVLVVSKNRLVFFNDLS
jgi:hypothetical protein